MSSWTPAPDGLQEVLGMLRDSASSDATVQKQVANVRTPSETLQMVLELTFVLFV